MFINISDVSLLCLPVGEGSSAEAGDTVPTIVVVEEESDCSVVVESTRRASWKWRDTEVPVLGELEDWKGEVLQKAVIMCLVKLDRGASMGIGGIESNIMDVVWFIHFFEWKGSLEQ
jgi:hypothetical protein